MDEIIKICKIGAIIQQALVGEGEATRDYMTQLADIAALDPEIAAECAPVIEEIVADELDHERKLWALFQRVTGARANKEEAI
mgnify:CR=1 FL=1